MTWPHREVQESWFRSALWLCVAWGNSVPSSGPQFHEVKHESWIAGCVGIFPGHTPSPQSPRSTDKAHNCRTAPFQLRWKINASSVSQAASSSTPRDPHNNTSIHPTPASFSLLSFDVQRAEKFTMPFFFLMVITCWQIQMKFYFETQPFGYKWLPPSDLAFTQGAHFSTFCFLWRDKESPQPPIAGFLLTFH